MRPPRWLRTARIKDSLPGAIDSVGWIRQFVTFSNSWHQCFSSFPSKQPPPKSSGSLFVPFPSRSFQSESSPVCFALLRCVSTAEWNRAFKPLCPFHCRKKKINFNEQSTCESRNSGRPPKSVPFQWHKVISFLLEVAGVGSRGKVLKILWHLYASFSNRIFELF